MPNQSAKDFISQLKLLTQPVVHGTQSRFLTPIIKYGLNYELSSVHDRDYKHNHFVLLDKEKNLIKKDSRLELIEGLLLSMCYATHGNLADINFSKHIENLFLHYTKKSVFLQQKNSLIHLIIATLLRKINSKHLKRKTRIKGRDLGCPLLLIYDALDKPIIYKSHHIEVGISEPIKKECLKFILAPEKYLPLIEYLVEDALGKEHTISIFPIEIIEEL
jgi:hypothetical protein